MANIVLITSLVACAFTIHKIIDFITLRLRRRSFIRRNNCENVPSLTTKDPILGLDLLWDSYSNIRDHNYLSTTLARFKENGSTFEANLLGTRVINTIDPENIKAILATQFKEFSLGDRRKNAFHPLLGAGIFTTDGAEWKRSRDLLKPAFSKSQLENVDLFEEHFQNMLPQIAGDGEVFDLQPLFFKLTMDIATHLFFGESCESLKTAIGEEDTAARFDLAFNCTQRTIADHFALGPAAILAPQTEFRENCTVVHEFVDNIVSRALEVHKAEEQTRELGDSDNTPEAHTYVVLNEALELTQDPLELRGLLLSLMVAGRDTTASLLSNFWFVLARSPRIWGKLKMEIDGLKGQRPDFVVLKDLTYLQYCLKEALRLFPSIPFNTRTAEVDTTLPAGGGVDGKSTIFVKAGKMIGYNVWVMHRRKSIYGEDADDFVPERWETTRPGWGYLPFNGGPRICLGQQLALTEAAYITARLVQTFSSIESGSDKREPWQESLTLSCCSESGVKIHGWLATDDKVNTRM